MNLNIFLQVTGINSAEESSPLGHRLGKTDNWTLSMTVKHRDSISIILSLFGHCSLIFQNLQTKPFGPHPDDEPSEMSDIFQRVFRMQINHAEAYATIGL